MGLKGKEWEKGELDSLIKTLGRCTSFDAALAIHNKSWRTGRTKHGTEQKLTRAGLGSPGIYLRKTKSDNETEEYRVDKLVQFIKRAPSRTFSELCDHMDMPPKRVKHLIEIAQGKGFKVRPAAGGDAVMLDLRPPKTWELTKLNIKPIRNYWTFAVASDIHFASIHHAQEELEDFIEFAYKERGVRTVLVPGDVLAGINMYRGQLNEIVKWGGKAQVEIAADQLPQHSGLRYKMIGGNHDESFMKASGSDPLERLAELRDDVDYLGFYHALIDVLGVRMELHHPEKAGSYAISYHLQKDIEQIPGGMKPHIAFHGHTHRALYIPAYRNVAAFYAGCFEGQTLYLKRKHIDPMIGGWIIRIGIDEAGSLKCVAPEFVHYFHRARHIGNPAVNDHPSETSVSVPATPKPARRAKARKK